MKFLKYEDDWKYCVSTSSSYMSLTWEETFFETRCEAVEYRDSMKKRGYAVLMVDREGY